MSNIVITGLGMQSPLGEDAAASWTALTRGSISDKKSSLRGLRRAFQMAETTVSEALSQAGLWDGRLQNIDAERVGCTVSASKPLFDGDTPRGPDVLNDHVRHRFTLKGEGRNIVAACATGAYAIAIGASWIEQDLCDVVVAGSVEPYPHPLIEAGFRQMGVTSSDGVTRPFDKNRSGFAFGEGAGAIVLESAESAKRRRAKPTCRLSGWAMGSDPHSAVAFNSGGAKIAGVIEHALLKARLAPQEIRHVNAHGTATKLNDWIETQALLKAFGSYAQDLMISATKASTGHLLGASGSVELVLTALALQKQFVPPTATLQELDPECPLDYTPGQGHAASFEHALSLSFGFGGPIAALVVSPL